jgi:hypothetical protein
MMATFSRGSIAGAMVTQILYEEGLRYKGAMLIPPGQTPVSTALVLSPVNTGSWDANLAFLGVTNYAEILASKEFRGNYLQAILPDADKGSISHGITFVQQSITGPMLRGEFLYVKWRVISSRQVFEDKVDLRSRLPEDIEYLNLHFVPKGSQLYVFLIYPWDGKSWEEEPLKNRFTPVPGGIRRFEGKKILQIYPDPSKQ